MTKIEVPATWYFDGSTNCLVYYERQYIEEQDLLDPKTAPKPTIIISHHAYQDLLDWIKKNERNIVKTDRTEDLKILHRFLDILEKKT
jgi:hypothetical protein